MAGRSQVRKMLPRSSKSSQIQSSTSSFPSNKASAYCLFCYKVINTSSDNEKKGAEERLKMCQQFCEQLVSFENSPRSCEDHADFFLGNQEKEKLLKFWDEQQQKRTMEGKIIYGACIDCFYSLEMSSSIFKQIETLQLNLKQNLQSIHAVMKYAKKVKTRVQEFDDTFMVPNGNNGNRAKANDLEGSVQTAGMEDREAVRLVRKMIFRTCAIRLNKKASTKLGNRSNEGMVLEKSEKNGQTVGNHHEGSSETIKKEVEEVSMKLNPSLYAEEQEENLDDTTEINGFPFEGASWMHETNEKFSNISTTDQRQICQCIKSSQTLFSVDDTQMDESTDNLNTSTITIAEATTSLNFLRNYNDGTAELASFASIPVTNNEKNSTVCTKCPELLSRSVCNQTKHYLLSHINGQLYKQNLFSKKCRGTCKKIFTTSSAVQANKKLKIVNSEAAGEEHEYFEGGRRTKNFHCRFCSAKFTTKYCLTKHFKVSHSVK